MECFDKTRKPQEFFFGFDLKKQNNNQKIIAKQCDWNI
jgi:hypothetical protein